MEKILTRIKKMLALANDAAATEQERDTALKMVYNLMSKHNLTMSDVPGDQQEGREEQFLTLCGDRWIRSACHTIADLFFCAYFYQRTGTSGKERHCFVGKVSNVATAMGMSEYVIKSIQREARKRYGSATSAEGRSFGIGATSSIRRRVEELKQTDVEDVPQASTSTALVLSDLRKTEENENNMWLVAQGTTLKTEKSRASTYKIDAFASGRSYGKTVSLNQQIGGTGKKQLG